MATLEKRKIYCPGGNQTIIPWLSSPQPSHYTDYTENWNYTSTLPICLQSMDRDNYMFTFLLTNNGMCRGISVYYIYALILK
jgi:hypothetical protein